MTSPFDVNPEVAAMKEDVAQRVFRLKTTETIITVAAVILGAIAAFTILPALAAGGGMTALGPAMLPLMLTLATGIGSYVTMKERKRLEIDQEFLQSRMQGRNWWGGYRQEVMEQGHGEAPQAAAMFSGIPAQLSGKERGK